MTNEYYTPILTLRDTMIISHLEEALERSLLTLAESLMPLFVV